VIDIWDGRQNLIDLPPRDPQCPCCGRGAYDYLTGSAGSDSVRLCGRDSVQVNRRDGARLDLAEVARRLGPLARVEVNRFLLRADIDAYRLTVFADGRAIIGGTTDAAVARSLYARYIGT